MRRTFGLRENQEFLSAVNDYQSRYMSICQMGGEYKDILKEHFSDKTNYWEFADFHIIQTTWGSTSGGWQGVGGAAMTTNYTVVIENKMTDAAFIYFNGQLAYICKMDEKYKREHVKGYRECDSLSLLYKFKQQR